MKVLAFLQNMWLKNPASFQRSLDRAPTPEYRARIRSRMIEYALFAGCLTGRRLKSALGPWCEEIIWEEANPTVADNPRDYYPPDSQHVMAALSEHCPDVVLCFTKAGEQKIRSLWTGQYFLSAPHPAARQADIIERLRDLRKSLDDLNRTLIVSPAQ